MAEDRCLLVFTKPARPGRVKTRLIGALDAGRAAELHQAFLDDLVARLRGGRFALKIAWALERGEDQPSSPLPAVRQRGKSLGERLYAALREAADEHRFVAAVGSDHPRLPLELVDRAFRELEGGAQVVLGPARDGGYYLIAAAARALSRELFEGVPWSTDGVLEATLERCRRLGLRPCFLPPADDVDTPGDLARLARELAGGSGPECPRTRGLLATWGHLPAA